MLFSSMIFLWVFLPIIFVLYHISDVKYKNIILLIASLIFYAWGEPKYILLMLLSIIINYIFGIIIEEQSNKKMQKMFLIVCICINLLILIYFKYFNFIVDNINFIMGKHLISLKNILLPIGISFYTFQALSYVVDVYISKSKGDNKIKAQKNIFNLALYISFFPQLIAGPIVKYHDIEKQIYNRECTLNRVAYGIKRFIYGLSKKVLISNIVAMVADEIFVLDPTTIGSKVAWIGIICYTLQIYFDFSGYSDMAIGLGEMFGFSFMENFNYPYISQSIQEFWRRWHISLSTWFKEYLYIPLGGNKKGQFRTYLNLLIVFFTTGLWHGASWNFIFWGLWHGSFIIIERKWLGRYLKNNKYKFINNIYVLFVVCIGWVFFRAETFSYGYEYIKAMFIPQQSIMKYTITNFVNTEVLIVMVIGIIGSGFFQTKLKGFNNMLLEKVNIHLYEIIILFVLLFMCITSLVSGTYNPFIYFRF